MNGRVLFIDDEANIRRSLAMIHRNAGWETAEAASGDEGLELLEREPFDLVYLDLSMPGRDGIDVLREIRLRRPDQLVVILTGNATIERAVEATRQGAHDFLEKDCGKEKILLVSRNALGIRELARENRRLRERGPSKQEFLGTSRAVREILGDIAKVAPTSARVLLLGESGTGKELLAQTIHDRSRRVDGPFVKVNCAAIPEELIEAELFGSVKGAYTGSVGTRVGKFQAADHGTLFLDEVGDMSLRVQTKVLRAIQEGEIERVGSDQTIRVDVRVVAATNKNLEQEVAAGRFREDLFFRLNVVPLYLPPLRDRPEDIALLAQVFLEEYCAENQVAAKTLAPETLAALERYPWPGNVRELRNQVERLVIMASGKLLAPEDLSVEIRSGRAATGRVGSPGASPAGELGVIGSPPGCLALEAGSSLSFREARRRFERELILRALERNRWNVTRAASELDLERTNLHKKIKAFGLSKLDLGADPKEGESR